LLTLGTTPLSGKTLGRLEDRLEWMMAWPYSFTGLGNRRFPVAQQSIKQRVLEAVKALPPDATIEDAMERLYFLAKIQRGLEQADAGDTMTHEEAKKRLLK